MVCVDRSLTLLAKYGYNVVRLPRTGIEPLGVFGRDPKGIELLGNLPTVWESTRPVPAVQGGNVAAEMKTVTTSVLKASMGLRVLEDILTGLGASVPKVDFAYSKKKSMTFSFSNIQIAKLDAFEVGKYLQAGDLQTDNPVVQRYFFGDDTAAFVITEVLKSDAVSVAADAASGGSVGLDVNALGKAVGADVKVEAEGTNQSTITYKGAQHLTFGFKAFRIIYDNGVWKVVGVDPSKADVFLDASDSTSEGVLLAKQDIGFGRVDLKAAGG